MAALDDETLAAIRKVMHQVKAPGAFDVVHNDECLFSYDTPFSPGGLYVSLASWAGAGEAFVALQRSRGNGGDDRLYVRLRHRKVLKPEAAPDAAGAADAPAKLAIGVSGGFLLDEQKYDVVKEASLVLLADAPPAGGASARALEGARVVPLPCAAVPEFVTAAVDAVVAHQGAGARADTSSWEADQELRVSKYAAGLAQLDNGVRISPDASTWRCAESGMAENLWLNLSTGHIGSGRRHWDGSGGTNGALTHYEQTGRQYPLVVKLGTITAHTADVYSYAADEDDLVRDPQARDASARALERSLALPLLRRCAFCR